MLCRKIREYLAEDRADEAVKDHLASCPSCRKAAADLEAQRALFRAVKEEPVPDRIWQNVKNAVISERLTQEERTGRGFLENILESIRPRRMALAYGCAFALILFVLATGIFLRQKQFSGGDMVFSIPSSDFVYDLGTSVEEYFL